MKNVLFPALIVLVLLWNYGTIFAQSQGKGSDANEQDRLTEKIRTMGRRLPPDANELRRQAEIRRLLDRNREQREKRRLEQLKAREMARIERERSRGGRDINQPGAQLVKGKDHQQRLEALRKQMDREQDKHLKRIARLKRIRELAVEEDSKQTVTRVDNIVRKELRRYNSKRERMRMRLRMLMRRGGRRRDVVGPNQKRLSEEARKAIEKEGFGRRDKGERSRPQ